MSNEVWSGDATELDGFTETDDSGKKHQVVWEEYEVMPDTVYDIWVCKTHNRPYYGACMKDLDK